MKKTKLMLAAGLLVFSTFFGLDYSVKDVQASQQVDCEIDSVEGNRGDTVTVNVKVTSNPGTIMSETRFAYDSDVVEVTNVTDNDLFRTDAIGDITSDWIAPNLAKNPIQLVNGFQLYNGNSENTGDLYTIELKIKDDAPLGKSEINFAGVFCDWELNDYEVNCESGTINVKCNHQVDEWEVVKEATDTEEGSRQGICVKCGETVTEVIAAKGTSGDDNKADDSNSSDKTDDSNSGNKTSDKTDNSNSGNKTSDKTDDSKSDVSNSTSKSTDTTKTAVKTGDTAVGVVFVIMMVATGTTVVVLKKKQHG